MPESNPFSKEFLTAFNKERTVHPINDKIETFDAIVKEFNQEKIASGGECMVLEHPISKEKLLALNFANIGPEKAKDIYYSQKILKTLFPHNFPSIYASFGDMSEDALNGTVREKITGVKPAGVSSEDDFYNMMNEEQSKLQKPWVQKIYSKVTSLVKGRLEKSTHPFVTVYNELTMLSREPYNFIIDIDPNPNNYIRTEDGDNYYVDTVKLGNRWFNLGEQDKVNLPKIQEYMREKNYSENEIATVTNSIKRLLTIYSKK
jgi:hypothetical protein